MTLMRGVKILWLSCICAFGAQMAVGQASAPHAEIVSPAQRITAPDFTLTDVQGKPFTLAALKGKVVLLDFWAIACGGCKLELPWYVGFERQYRSKGLSLVGLDMYGETPEAVRAFAAAHQMRYPLAIGTDAIGALYHLGAMPLTVLIDRKGRIAVSHTGVVDPKLFEADIKTVLAE